MSKLLKLKTWITIVLLSCFTSLSANSDTRDSIPFTGEVVKSRDSVLISYDDLRLANSKLVELRYTKTTNALYRNIIKNDSIIIKDYTELNTRLNNDCKRAIKQRNIAIGGSILITVLATIFILVK